MVSYNPLALLTRVIKLCDRREHRMLDREILIQVRDETLVADAGVNAIVRRLPEEFLPVASDLPPTVAVAGKRLVALL
jgi:hypothetical protein